MAYTFDRHTYLIDWMKRHKDICEQYKAVQRQIQRGAIFFCELGENVAHELSGKRPVLIVSDSNKNKYNDNVTVVPLTSAWHKLKDDKKEIYRQNKAHIFKPTDYQIRNTQYLLLKSQYQGLSNDSIVTCENIRTVSKARISPNSIALVKDRTMKEVEKRILETLSMNDYKIDNE